LLTRIAEMFEDSAGVVHAFGWPPTGGHLRGPDVDGWNTR